MTEDDSQADSGRSVLPHRDPTFDAVVELARSSAKPLDWRLTGPSLVRQRTKQRHRDNQGAMVCSPAVSDQPVQFNLEPDVAAEMLRYLVRIAEPTPSRSGKTKTLRMKKGPAATGPQSKQ